MGYRGWKGLVGVIEVYERTGRGCIGVKRMGNTGAGGLAGVVRISEDGK